MKILITAFDAFGGESQNPALEAVKALKTDKFKAEIVKLEVPTVFYKSIDVVYKKMLEVKPDAVICLGQAGGRFGITCERVAINQDDARIKDNDGNQPIDSAIFKDGDSAYFSTLPIKAITRAIISGGLPASVSNSAGTFVCNHLMYGVLYYAAREFPNCRAGFIHIPYLPAQVANKMNTPSMALQDIVRGLEIAINTVITCENDICAVGGTVC